MDARQRDFPEAGRGDAIDLAKDLVERNAPRRAPCRRNDAVRTRLGAPGLDAQRIGRAAHHAGLDRRAAWTIPPSAFGFWWASSGRRKQRYQTGLVVVPDNTDDIGQR